MRNPVTTFKGESFFPHDLLIYVNRSIEDFNVPLHNHDFVEIAYVAEGTGFHHVGGEVRKVRKGDMYVLPVGVPHVFRPATANPARHPLAVYNCVISPRLLERLDPFVTDRSVAAFMHSLPAGDFRAYSLQDDVGELDRLFRTLHREFMLPLPGSSDYLHTLLLQLFILIGRFAGAEPGPASLPSETYGRDPLLPAVSKKPFARVLAELDRRIQQETTLADLAESSGYSERHLQRLFRQHTGQSFHSYRQSRRIERSCELIRHTELKIGAIAEQVGYKDVDTFASVFKRCTGIAPNAYRKQSRQTDRSHL